MRLHFLLAGVLAFTLGISAPDASAHGSGGGHGGGNFHGGFHGGGFHGGGFHGHGRHFFHGRFFGPSFGYYGYPWWGWDYGYYPYSYYGYDAYYGGPNDTDHDSQLNSSRAVQAALAWRGFYSGRIDGVVGPETRSAIRSFQANRGLPVTGRIDNRLIDALQQR